MFHKKRTKTVIAGLLLAVLMLTGCASGEDDGRLSVTELKAGKYVTPGEYQNLAITVAPAEEVTQAWVEEQAFAYYLEEVKRTGKGGITDRPVALGDTVVMDYVGKKDGVAFAGGTASNAELVIGSGRFIDGFEDGLIGVKPGETVDLNLTFPQNYGNAELAGAKVVFTVTLHCIVPDTMTDESVAELANEDYSNVTQLEEFIRTQLEETVQSDYQQNVEAAMIIELIDNAVYQKVPEELVAGYAADIEADVRAYAAMYNMDADTFCNYVYGTGLAEYVAEGSNVTAQQMLVLQAIAEKENLNITDQQLKERTEVLARENGWESAEQLLAEYDEEQIRESLMMQDVLAFLSKTVQITHE